MQTKQCFVDMWDINWKRDFIDRFDLYGFRKCLPCSWISKEHSWGSRNDCNVVYEHPIAPAKMKPDITEACGYEGFLYNFECSGDLSCRRINLTGEEIFIDWYYSII